jgi:hypothetical protein
VDGWLILIYKIPPEPSRLRAGIWRKLKAAGAIYLQNGVAALPAGPASERALRGIAQAVRGMGGTAQLFHGRLLGDEEAVRGQFNAARDEEYSELLARCRDFHAELDAERAAGKYTFAELEENEDDLAKLAAWLDRIRVRDQFEAPLRAQTERAIAVCREDLEVFAASVYAAVDHGSAAPANGDEAPGTGAAERTH